MARHLQIEGGVAVNAVEVDDPANFPQWTLQRSDSADIGDLWDGQTFTRPAPVVDRAALASAIDAAVLAVYDRPMRFSKEYELREAAALDYQASGYSGDVPARISGFATPAGLTAQAATDLILAQAAQLRGALAQLGDLRMQKYAVLGAASDAAAQAVHDQTLAAIAAIGAAIA